MSVVIGCRGHNLLIISCSVLCLVYKMSINYHVNRTIWQLCKMRRTAWVSPILYLYATSCHKQNNANWPIYLLRSGYSMFNRYMYSRHGDLPFCIATNVWINTSRAKKRTSGTLLWIDSVTKKYRKIASVIREFIMAWRRHVTSHDLGPRLLMWINFNLSVDK